MTARVITVTSGKGGVGKTTATANLGVALATLGNKVVCIDADIGLRNLDVVMGLENRIVYDLVDVVEGRARLRQAMIRDKRLKDELYLIPAAQTRDKTAVSPSDMVRLCDEVRSLVDYVLIDSPAGIERGFRNAIAPADDVLIVTNPEVSSVRDADRIIGLIEAEGKGPGKLIINRIKVEMVKRGDMLSPEDIIDILAIDLIGLIPENESILVSTNRGMPVALNADETDVGQAFHNVARRLMGEDVPFMPLEEEATWLQKLLRGVGLSSQSKAAEPAPSTPSKPPKPPKPPASAGKTDEKVKEKPRTAKPTASARPRPAPAGSESDKEPDGEPEKPAEKTAKKPASKPNAAKPASILRGADGKISGTPVKAKAGTPAAADKDDDDDDEPTASAGKRAEGKADEKTAKPEARREAESKGRVASER
jgi:septum site-determining protein MinD